ncbi:hypothetical protein M3Y97_00641100 [Aphelenchoides bicaudatus]|nr:hypothetical protein M3Y97_00641100 [Aphelenchoides bicaudatus]
MSVKGPQLKCKRAFLEHVLKCIIDEESTRLASKFIKFPFISKAFHETSLEHPIFSLQVDCKAGLDQLQVVFFTEFLLSTLMFDGCHHKFWLDFTGLQKLMRLLKPVRVCAYLDGVTVPEGNFDQFIQLFNGVECLLAVRMEARNPNYLPILNQLSAKLHYLTCSVDLLTDESVTSPLNLDFYRAFDKTDKSQLLKLFKLHRIKRLVIDIDDGFDVLVEITYSEDLFDSLKFLHVDCGTNSESVQTLVEYLQQNCAFLATMDILASELAQNLPAFDAVLLTINEAYRTVKEFADLCHSVTQKLEIQMELMLQTAAELGSNFADELMTYEALKNAANIQQAHMYAFDKHTGDEYQTTHFRVFIQTPVEANDQE